MAITLYQSCGFETADSTELRTATSIGYETTVVKTGDYSASVANGQGFTMGQFDGTGRDAGGIHCITFHWRCTSVTTNGWFQVLESYATDATGDVGMALAYNDTTGNLEMYDEAGYSSTPVATTSWTPSTDTWYHIAVLWEPNVASGDYAVFIDGTEMVSGTTGDFLHATGNFDVYNFTGDSDAGTMYFDDVCVWTGLESTDDYLSSLYQPRIHRYRSTKASAVPDGPASPTTLDAGTWSAAHGVSSTDTINAEYTGGVSYGTVNCDDAGGSAGTGGPNTDTEVGDYIVCTKIITRASRSGGGGTAQYVMAHGSQSTSSVTGGVTADSGTLDVSSEMTTGGGIRYSRDGTHLYVNDGLSGSGITYQYDLTTAWDLSTASYASKSLDASSYVTGFPSLEISSNGSYVFIGDTGTDDIFTFTLSTPWDLSTGSYTRTKAGTVLDGIAFSEDGLESVTTNNGTAPLRQTYTTAWDTSTWTSTATGVTTPDNPLIAIQWSENGRYLLSKRSGLIEVYHCTRAFDVRSMQATPIGVNPFDPYSDATSVGAACFGKGGEKLVILESTPSSSGNGLVKQYTLSTPYSAWNTDASFKSTSMTVSGDLNLDTSLANYVTYSETVFPRTNEYLAIGIEKDGGGQDYDVAWQVGQVISVLDPPVTATNRTVTQDREGAGDLTSMTFTENAATITIGTPRNVTCTTEAVSMTESAAQVATDTRNIVAAPKQWKKWKGLDFQTVTFDASEWQNPNAYDTIANAFDGSISTYCVAQWENAVDYDDSQMGRGISTKLGPIGAASDVPLRVEVRAYVSNTADIKLYTIFQDTTAFDFSNGTPESHSERGATQLAAISDPTGAWSDWQVVPGGIWGWDDPHNNTATEPLSWDAINNDLSIGFLAPNGSSPRIHAIELRVTSGPSDAITVGYFDGSGGAPDQTSTTDWTNMTNADDGSLTTWCSAVENNAGWMQLYGTNLTQPAGASDEILGIYYRIHGRLTWSNGATEGCGLNVGIGADGYLPADNIPVLDSEGASNYGFVIYNEYHFSNVNSHAIETSNSAFWSPWYEVDLTSVKWSDGADKSINYLSWDRLGEINATIASTSGFPNTTVEVAKFEVAVLAAPTNAKRRGSLTKFNRVVTGTTETIALDGTNYPATVSRARGVNQDNAQPGDLTTISMTENAATVSFATHRTVTGLTEEITMPATGSLNLARGVSSSPEALQLAEVASTTNASRVTSGVTEVLSSTSAGTNVETARGVQSGTEALSMASTGAVNRARNKASATEQVTMPGTLATISTSANLDVTCTTEAISFTETPASVNGTRIAAATAEITAFVENASTVNTERSVSATTETLALTDNDSTVNLARNKVSPTEAISLVEGSSTVDRQRGVNAGTEALSLTESAANVNGKRIAAASAELTALAENTANINRARDTIGVTESVTISENASVVDRQRGVNAGTEAVVMAESLSTVTRGSNLDVTCTTEAITLAENAATISADRAVNATTEVVSLDALASDTNFNRTVLTTSESVVMTESQATVDTAASNNPRNVTCTTEAVSFAEAASTANLARNKVSPTEAITLAGVPAGVNGVRIVGSSVALSALAESGATVNLSRTVTSLTDELVMTEVLASVSTSSNRIVNATTEQLSVQESSAASNQTRGVSSSTEVLAFAEQSSSIQVLRNVVATTEQLALAEAGATVLTTRDVIGLTSSLLMTESAGQVFRGANLDVTGTTQAIAFTETAAAVAFPRNVSGLTEQISLVTVPSTLNRPWLVTCTTEELSFTEGLAKVAKTRTGAMPGSIIWVHPETKPVWVSD